MEAGDFVRGSMTPASTTPHKEHLRSRIPPSHEFVKPTPTAHVVYDAAVAVFRLLPWLAGSVKT